MAHAGCRVKLIPATPLGVKCRLVIADAPLLHFYNTPAQLTEFNAGRQELAVRYSADFGQQTKCVCVPIFARDVANPLFAIDFDLFLAQSQGTVFSVFSG